ncbi:MAG: hypothetical protein FJ403_21940 [Verrucomicrobia bacterium]|nr:hypothetical protein [Verrucomicrobiota bacterium]
MRRLVQKSLWLVTWLLWLVSQEIAGAQADSAEPKDQGSSAPKTESGIIEGIIIFEGEVPKSSLADDAGVRHPLLEVDPTTQGVRYVAAFLVAGKPAGGTNEHKRSPSQEQLVVDQQNYNFVPHLIAIHSGEIVAFKNSDVANHNVRTTSSQPANEFNVYTSSDSAYRHRFVADSKQRPIRLGCDLHPWMTGWIYVLDHSNFAVSDSEGKFRITSVLPGKYQLHLQQPDVGWRKEQTITVAPKITNRVEIRIRLGRGFSPQ